MTSGSSLGDAIDELLSAVVRGRTALAITLDLRPVDLDALRLVVTTANASPAAIAQMLRLSTGGTAAIVDRLAQAGLVTRRAAQLEGRRRVLLEPTSEGHSALHAHREAVLELAQFHSDADRLHAEQCLRQAARALDRQTARELATVPSREEARVPDPTMGVRWG